jgi:hypothetical protein
MVSKKPFRIKKNKKNKKKEYWYVTASSKFFKKDFSYKNKEN